MPQVSGKKGPERTDFVAEIYRVNGDYRPRPGEKL
jgi:hypothetical protein